MAKGNGAGISIQQVGNIVYRLPDDQVILYERQLFLDQNGRPAAVEANFVVPGAISVKQNFENIAYFRVFVDFPHTIEIHAYPESISIAEGEKNFAQLIAVLPQDFLILQL
jgi:hypothetical protein